MPFGGDIFTIYLHNINEWKPGSSGERTVTILPRKRATKQRLMNAAIAKAND